MGSIKYNPVTKCIEVSDHKLHDTLRSIGGRIQYVPCPMLYFTGEVGVIPVGEVLGVWCYPDQEVIWTWYNERVIGYTIVDRV